MSKIIVVSGASSGFGALAVRDLADAGHRVYAGMRATEDRNAPAVVQARDYAAAQGVDLRPIELDVSDQSSVDRAIAAILAESGRIDVVVHNAGHMVLGPTEAFSIEQLSAVYDANVLTTQRLNQAVLPHLRERGDGLLVWVGSTSARGGTPPYLAPYFAAKAAEDSLAVSYAVELGRFGIDSVIIVPGSFTTGTNHFAHAGSPDRDDVAAQYSKKLGDTMDVILERLGALSPADADPSEVAKEITRVVDLPKGKRPFRVYIDPAEDGAERVFELGDEVRREFYERIGMSELLSPITATEVQS